MNKLNTLATLIVCLLVFPLVAQEKKTVAYYDDLSMDIYLPEGEPSGIVLYVHGGGFSGGSREGAEEFCWKITLLGNGPSEKYAAVTMSYRLLMKGKGFGCDISAEEKKNVFLESGRDIARATAWILENGESFGLPTEKVILAGSSAGAEAILHAAYWDETRYQADGTPILPGDFNYAAVISMAGALFDLSLITEETAIPTQLFHGTCDQLVPYASAPHHYCAPSEPGYIILHGSGSIAARLAALGKPFSLITECGGGHEWAGKPMGEEYFRYIADFLEKEVSSDQYVILKETIPGSVGCDYPDLDVCQ